MNFIPKVTNEKIKNIIYILSRIYLFLFGLFWILIHLYFRIILDRPNYNFNDLKHQITLKLYIIFIIFALLHFLFIFLALFLLLRKKSINPNSIFYKINLVLYNVLNKVYWRPLEYIHDLMAPNIPGSGRFFMYLATKWRTKRQTYILIFIFEVLPKFILAMIFFIDTVIFNHLYIFLYCLPLIFVPILYSVFLKLFLSFVTRNISAMKEPFESIKGVGTFIYNENGEIVDNTSYEYTIKYDYSGWDDAEIDEWINNIKKAAHICNIVDFNKKIINKISPYLLLVTSLLYLIGGVYRLLVIFF